MAYTTYNCDAMKGGAARALDALSVGSLTTGDRAIVATTAAAYYFKYNSTGTAAEQTTTAPRVVRPDDYATGGNWEEYVFAAAAAASVLAQVQSAVVTAVVSGTTVIPVDDTIPQNTEGFEVITCAITPKSASNILLITAQVNPTYHTDGTNANGLIALFQDTTANALACAPSVFPSSKVATLTHKMVANTIVETTFKIRFGSSSVGTVYINGQPASTSRVGGGVCASTLTIMEYTP
jgi:hypothetical protein